jgi:lipid A 3-O-deacylase
LPPARLAALLAAAALLAPLPARAQQPPVPDTDWTGTILEEDDYWAPHNHDRHYTHGIQFSGTSGDVQDPLWLAPFGWFGPLFPDQPDVSRRYNLIPLGQNIYTPDNPLLVNPDPRDRPYAGWAYGGVGMMQDAPGTPDDAIDRFDDLELKLGLVGPGTLAHETQNSFHLLIDEQTFQGWHAQLHNEPALDLFYQHKWRFHGEAETGSPWGWDAIPQWDLRVGNVYDYAGAGGMLRLGRNLRADYGPPHIDMNLGANYINPARMIGNWGFYGFIGTEARAVGHDIFLDGNSFKSSPSVDKYPAVDYLESGVAFFYDHFRLAYSYIWETPEFVHQAGPDHYGSLNLTVDIKF